MALQGNAIESDVPESCHNYLHALPHPSGPNLNISSEDPVTHLNLDQLLEIVQSFQFDSNMSSHGKSSLVVDHGASDGFKATVPENVDQPGFEVAQCDMKRSSEGDVRPPDFDGCVREIHSCPNSPTETDCSSGFSTLRRRSVTLTEKIRTNCDGKKIQLVRQYGYNTSSVEANQSTYQQKLYTFANRQGVSSPEEGISSNDPGQPGSAANFHQTGSKHHSNLKSSFGDKDTPAFQGASSFRSDDFAQLNTIEPNTVMFSIKDYSYFEDVTVMEIIDELHKQFSDKLWDFQGVRIVSDTVYICLSQKESLQHLTTYGFYIRGTAIKLVDATSDSIVMCMSGVPHYISDSTVTMLVNTFGTAIGEVERRFYKGIDTGERYVRLKPRGEIPIPDQVTVGGCKIVLNIISTDSSDFANLELSKSHSDHRKAQNPSADMDSGLQRGNIRFKSGHSHRTKHSSGDPSVPTYCDDTSPKNAKSFCNTLLRSGLTDDIHLTYVAAEPLNFPTLSPPPYKTSSSAGSSSTSNCGERKKVVKEEMKQTSKMPNKSESSSPLVSETGQNSYGPCNNKTSSGKQEFQASLSPSKSITVQQNQSASKMQRRTTTSKTLNGILQKSSLVIEEPVLVISKVTPEEKQPSLKSTKEDKDLTLDSQKSKTVKEKKLSNKSISSKSSKSDTQSDVQAESTLVRKSSSKSQLKVEKTGKDLALTRDLPWCGCWGNGCL